MVHELFSQGTLRAWKNGAFVPPTPAEIATRESLPYVHELFSRATRLDVAHDLKRQSHVTSSQGYRVKRGISLDGGEGLDHLNEGDTDVIVGDYTLGERVGVGGMGVVYSATRIGSDTRLAVKVIRTAKLAQSDERGRFRQEITTLARLRHPNICRLLDFGHAESVDYFVMEFIDGITFEHWLQREQPDRNRIVKVLAIAAEAVAHANAQGVIHRDINPANIMVRDDGDPVIMDFGLARDMESEHRMTLSGIAVGTPMYMSPEGTLGKTGEIGPWTDIWALGAVGYYALTGQPPFAADSDHELFKAINEREPKPLRHHRPDVPTPLQRIILRCLQKIPAERYANGNELAIDLHKHLAGERVSVSLPSFMRVSIRRIKRNPLIALLIVCLLISSAVISAILTINHMRQFAGWSEAYHYVDGGLNFPEGSDIWDGKKSVPIDTALIAKPGGGFSFTRTNQHLVPLLRIPMTGNKDGVRVDFTADYTINDAIEFVINASGADLPEVWQLPPGWQIKLYRADISGISAQYLTEPTLLRQDQSIPIEGFDNTTSSAHITIIQRNNRLTVSVNDQIVVDISEPLLLSEPGPSWLVMRAWQPDTVIRDLRIHRLSNPDWASPLTAAESMQRQGLRDAAYEEYLIQASDRAGSELGETALIRAIELDMQRLADGVNTAPGQLIQRLLKEYSSPENQLFAKKQIASLEWLRGNFDDGMDVIEDIIDSAPTDIHPEHLLALSRERFSKPQAHRAAQILANLPGRRRLDLSNLQLTNLDFIQGRRLLSLNASCNLINDISALNTIRADRLDLSFNLISDISPLAGHNFDNLDISHNPIINAGALSMIQSAIVNIAGTEIASLPPLAAGAINSLTPPHLLDISRNVEALAATNHISSARISSNELKALMRTGSPPRIGNITTSEPSIPLDLYNSGIEHIEGAHFTNLDAGRINWPVDLTTNSITFTTCSNVDVDKWGKIARGTLNIFDSSIVGDQEWTIESENLSISNSTGIPSWPAIISETLTTIRLDQLPWNSIGRMNNAPRLRTLTLKSLNIIDVSNLNESSVVEIGSDRASLTNADWSTLDQTRINLANTDALLRSIHAGRLVNNGQPHLLRTLAVPIGDQLVVAVPGPMTEREASELANLAGGHLMTIASGIENQAAGIMAQPIVAAWIGLTENSHEGRWDNGQQTLYRGYWRNRHFRPSLPEYDRLSSEGNIRWIIEGRKHEWLLGEAFARTIGALIAFPER